ncbi:hypothetical protein [Streptosporangium sp. NPDC020145]|uniref:hypothetical protein n=1 Tax=Streptosporangium sp. NPDC020145 TaxID=3154694 RepID=UPI0034292A31
MLIIPPSPCTAVRAYSLPGSWPALTITMVHGERAVFAMDHLAPVDALRTAERLARAASAYATEARKAFTHFEGTERLQGRQPDPWTLPDFRGAVLLDTYRPGG